MVAGNVTGEKFSMFVIGKSKTPRCFKHIKKLPWKYKSEKKRWMESQIFEEWVRKLDRTIRIEGRKIVLLIDNCPAHLSVSDVTYVQPLFFSPNTTSVLQLMDQDVIRGLKVHYRGRVVHQPCRAIDKTKTYTSIFSTNHCQLL